MHADGNEQHPNWRWPKCKRKKKILCDYNYTMEKMDRNGGNKTHCLHRYCSNYFLSKLIFDNWLEDLWRKENQIPLSSPTTVGLLAKILDRQGLYWYKNC